MNSNSLSEARLRVLEVLTLGLVRWAVPTDLQGYNVQIFPSIPSTLQPPCVVIFPGSPWRTPTSVTLDVRCYVALPQGGTTALASLEQLVEDVRRTLTVAGLHPSEVDRPQVNPDAHTLHADIPLTLDALDC